MNKTKTIIFVILFIVLTTIFAANVIGAEKIDLGMNLVNYNPVESGWGEGFDILENGSSIKPNDIVQLDLNYNHPGMNGFTTATIQINYDNKKVEPLLFSDWPNSPKPLFISPFNFPSSDMIFPHLEIMGSISTDYTRGVSDSGEQIAIVYNSENKDAVLDTGKFLSLFFRIKEDVNEGDIIGFSYSKNSAFSAFREPVAFNSEEVYLLIEGGLPVQENNNVDMISAMGRINDSSHDYLSGVFDTKQEDGVAFEKVFVPYDVDYLEFSHVLQDLESKTIVEWDPLPDSNNKFNLDVGDNNFKAVVKNSKGEQVKTYDFSFRRLSIDNKANVIGSDFSGSQFIFNNDNITTVPANTESINLQVNTSGDYSLSGENIAGDTLTLSKNLTNTKFNVSIAPESKKKEYDLIPLINSSNRGIVGEYEFIVSRESDPSLASLKVTYGEKIQEEIIENFKETSDDLYEYTYNVSHEINEIEIDPIVNHKGSTFKIDPILEEVKNYKLQTGNNIFSITVTPEIGVNRTYKLVVNRDKNSNNKLKSLKINGSEIVSFNENTNDYTIDDVDESVSKLTIEAVKYEGANQAVTIENNNLIPGQKNVVKIVVTAENGDVNTYSITVFRPLTSNVELEDGAITPTESNNNHRIEKLEQYEYNVYVPFVQKTYSKDDFELNLENGQTVEYGEPITLKSTGDNKYVFTIISPNEDVRKKYTLNIIRMATNIPFLTSISINDTKYLDFESEVVNGVQEINLDNLIDENASTFKLSFEAKEGILINPISFDNIELKGKRSIEKTVNISDDKFDLENSYKFIFKRSLSSNAELSNIKIDKGDLNPEFGTSPNNIYEVSVPSSQNKLTITADAVNQNTTILNTGEKTLIPGLNQFVITSIPEDGINKIQHTINVYRHIGLERLEIGGVDVLNIAKKVSDESGNTLTFDLTDHPFDASMAIADLVVVANDTSVTIVPSSGSKVNLDGSPIEITLTAKDKETKLKVFVKYERPISTDASLENINVNIAGQDVSLTFKPDEQNYDIVVDHRFKHLIKNEHLEIKTKHPNTKIDAAETLTLKEGDNLYTIKTTAEDNVSEMTYTINIKQKAYNLLSNLKISEADGYLEQSFDPEKFVYDAIVYPNKEYFDIDWEVDPSLGVTVTNQDQLKNISTSDLDEVNSKEFVVSALSRDGDTSLYKINVKKGFSTRLISMDTSVGKLDFDPNKKEYDVVVSNDVEFVSLINIEKEDKTAQISDNHSNVNIKENPNSTVPVTVTVSKGSQTTDYIVNFIKTQHETEIDKIIITDGSKIYESSLNDDGTFEIIVGEDSVLTELELEVDLKIPGGGVEISKGTPNSKGELDFTISVTDKNGITKDYQVTVKNELSNNNYLETIKFNGTKLGGFNRETLTYQLDFNIGEKFELSANAEHESAEVKILKPEVLKDGSIIEINVKSEKGNIRTYTVKLSALNKKTADISYLNIKEIPLIPGFNTSKTEYYVTIPYELDKVTVEYKVENGSTAEIIAPDLLVKDDNTVSNLEVGTNKIEVKVTSEDSSDTQSYYINVTRSKKADNYLRSLEIHNKNNNDLYKLSPLFTENNYNYVVEIPRNVNSFSISADPKISTHKVVGDGDVTIVNYPFNHIVKVIDEFNVIREYSITFIQEKSENTNLANIVPSIGNLSPLFEASNTYYNIELPHDVDNITFDWEEISADQEVVLIGPESLDPGSNIYQIKVSSGHAEKIYTINVTRAFVDSPKLDSLTVSNGELDPMFTPEKKLYHVDVDSEVNSIIINAECSIPNVIVTGAGEHPLAKGVNTFEIILDAGGNVKESYFVVVNRNSEKEPEEDLNLDLIYLALKNEQLNEKFDSSRLEYSAELSEAYYKEVEVIAIPQNRLAKVEIINNKDIGIGERIITVRVFLSQDVFKDTNIKVNVSPKVLKSDIHEIDDLYISTIKEQQKVIDVKNQMINENSQLEFFKDGEKMQDNDIVGTGVIIKLVINGRVHDERALVVLGDLNGNGIVDISDMMQTLSKLLGGTLTDIQAVAADTNRDGQVRINDFMQIQSHILKVTNIHGEEGGS